VRLREDETAFGHVPAEQAAAKVEEGRIDVLREALCLIMPFADEGGGLSRKEIWDRLPAAVKVNRIRFESILEAENGNLWVKEGNGGRGGYRHRRVKQ
jgi:hypothetical protein